MSYAWYASYPSGVPFEIDPEAFASIKDLFELSCQQYAELTAFRQWGMRLSYAKLEQQSRWLAAYMQRVLQLKKGDRVALMLPNILQYPVALFGILRAGLVVVNLNPLYTSGELKSLLLKADVQVVIVLENFASVLEDALQTVKVPHVIRTQVGDCLKGMKGFLVNFFVQYVFRKVPFFSLPQSIPWSRIIKLGRHLLYDPPVLLGEDLAFLQYTGGTMGSPKAVMLSHRNIVANVLQCQAWVSAVINQPGEVVLGALPFYHIFSLVVSCITFVALGGECLLISDPRDVKGFLSALSKVSITVFIGLDTLLHRLMSHPDFAKVKWPRLKLTIVGGMPMRSSLANLWYEKTGAPVIQGYGLTEASPVVCINPVVTVDASYSSKAATCFNESVGLPLPSTHIKIESGELCVKGPQVMQGYWKAPEETNDVIHRDWLHTGDMARLDEKGFIYLEGRKKEMILVSGFNVYPQEVEEVLLAHPEIIEAAVLGIPDKETGEAVKACVVRKEKALLTEEMLISYCCQQLAHYKIPKTIQFCETLPKSPLGKVLKRALIDA